ncbi:hypothetical protein K435DRAFT_869326 [Dendrothele bispora CBS 962.96]|uniref:Uncharacterized protein n=2 Tax=Dendrothele bispora (strain CBS 962.96) TaxID=1314807 RepID=A0A4S8L9Z2_DENBC|nr:hypothetical protein K435DRAFT_869326 [Dendrothele bispora CBS 962.96]
MALFLTEADLLKNKDSSAIITYTDGLTGAIHARTQTFITSPNCLSIPRPPFGSTRDLYRRADARYGEDDPLQWPQPFNSSSVYLPCLPVRPTASDHSYYEHDCLWHTLDSQDLSFTPDGYATKEGVIRQDLADRLSKSVEYVRARHSSIRTAQPQDDWALSLLNEFNATITICLHRLTSVSSSFRSHAQGLVEMQRACLYSHALIDYVEILRPRMSAQHASKQSRTERRMGAFVWNDDHALSLFSAGLPVYYVRLFSDFDRQNILDYCELEMPSCVITTASPPYPIIYSGQAGADQKFAAIRQASISCYNVESPFQNMHLPGQYTSSYTIGSGRRITSVAESPASTSALSRSGPIRSESSQASTSGAPYQKDKQKRRGKHQAKNPPKVQRDIFADLPSDHDIVPPPILTWRDANKTIDTWHPDCRYTSGQRPKVETIVPDPAVIIGPESRERQNLYLSGWTRLREPWLQRCRDLHTQQKPLTVALWRRILGLNSSSQWKGGAPQNPNEEELKQATELIQSSFAQYAPNSTPFPPSPPPIPSLPHAKELMRELTLINFRYQLLHVDEIVDTSRPQVSPTLTRAELSVALTNHRRSRIMLVEDMFDGCSDSFTLTSLTSNFGFAADNWSSRVGPLRSFWRLMCSWPGTKADIWDRGEDPNLPQMSGAGEEWERALVRFYVQTHFNVVGYPPVLPRRI